MLNKFQIEKLTHLFHIIDYDHNGQIQESDFIGLAENIEIFTGVLYEKRGNVSLKDESTKLWNDIKLHFDSTTLQSINLEQWLSYLHSLFFSSNSKTVNRNIRYLVSKIHKVFDRDEDILISKLEFMSIFVSCRVEVKHADDCFKAIDTNKDGYISYMELETAADEFFRSQKLDANGNKLFGKLGSSHFKLSQLKS